MDGARVMKEPGGSKKKAIWIAAGAVLAVLLCAYLGLCAWVGSTDKIMNNVSVSGMPVGGLAKSAAWACLSDEVAQAGSATRVELNYGHWSGTLDGAAAQLSGGQDGRNSALAAWQVGRDSFLLQGGAYVAHLLGASAEVPLYVELSQEGVQTLEQLLNQADQKVGGAVTNARYAIEGEQLLLTKGVTGVAIDRAQARQQVEEMLAQALSAQLSGQTAQAVVELPAQQTAPQEPDFDAIHQELYTQAQDAAVDPETYQVLPHTVGVDFDPHQAKAAFDAAAEGETVAIPLTITQPAETQQSLEGKLFADVLGEATSQVSGSANRNFNVKLSAQACNNIVLMPGQVFSYNNATGSRSADKGYKPAPVYVNGRSEEETGGGICQTSSTIYNAVLYTRLKIVERKNHMYAVGYVPDGMDATVYYGALDFRFENSTPYPIKVVTNYYDSNGKHYLNVKIYGTKTDDITAKLERVQFDWVQPGITYIADENQARGTTRTDTQQTPYTGRKATVYRYLYDAAGALIEKQNLGTSSYKSRNKIVYYNPLDGDPATWPDGVPPVYVEPTPTPEPGGTDNPGQIIDPGIGTGPEDPQNPEPQSPQTGSEVSDPVTTQPADNAGAQEKEPSQSAQDIPQE